MSKVLLALTSVALLGLSGCAEMETSQPPAKAAEAKATISPEAQAALSDAQKDVKMAMAKFALWTTAKDALEDAEEAAKKGDSAAVLKYSKLTSDMVQKGMAQLDYPMLKVGK
jgi:hypothetical protein